MPDRPLTRHRTGDIRTVTTARGRPSHRHLHAAEENQGKGIFMNSKLLRRGAAVLSAAGIAGLTTVTAHATDVLPFACVPGGAAITGDGSSFQNAGVQAEITAFASCGSVTYTATGSGKGITDITARTVQFAGTDVPYSDAQWAAMQAGGGTNASHVETIPVALGAVAVAVNEPCAAGKPVSGTRVAQIYAGKLTTWDQVVAGCPADHITAWHRSGNSGTTTAFKTYLTKKDAADFGAGCLNTTVTPPSASCYKDPTPTWPAPGSACAGANTNQNLVTCLKGTAGSIAYLDLADSSSNGASVLAVDNANGGLIDLLDSFNQPALRGLADTIGSTVGYSTLGFATPTAGQCTAAAQTNATPTSSSADWAQVDVTNGPNGYGVCTYTYQLAFDTPVRATNASAAQAITIGNFISYEVSDAGQAVFTSHNYDALPVQVQALAQAAAHTLLTAN
jgi:ABC-type phosphate transport system substrate-binding protein